MLAAALIKLWMAVKHKYILVDLRLLKLWCERLATVLTRYLLEESSPFNYPSG
jgi:hypothetical protein